MRRFVPVLLVLAGMAGCRSGDPAAATIPPEPPSVTGFPRDVAGDQGPVLIPSRPDRIVSLSSTHTEMLYALGASDRVVATDLYSDYPPEAAGTPKLDAFNFSAEQVAAYEPDLVILAFDSQGESAALEALGITALVLGPADHLDDVYSQLEVVGEAIDRAESAAGLIEVLRREIDGLLADVEGLAAGRTVYHEIDPTFYAAASSTFVGDIYRRLGLTNIADLFPDEFGGGFPQLSAEFIFDQDPDLIVTSDGLEEADLAARPGWASLSAVRAGAVIALDPDLAQRWGPRTGSLVAAVVDGLRRLTP